MGTRHPRTSSTTLDENVIGVCSQRSQVVDVAATDRAARFGCRDYNGIDRRPSPGQTAEVSRSASMLTPPLSRMSTGLGSARLLCVMLADPPGDRLGPGQLGR
jgi:hypothetical protein